MGADAYGVRIAMIHDRLVAKRYLEAQKQMWDRVIKQNMEHVVTACRTIRCAMMETENDIHSAVKVALIESGLAFYHEARILPNGRIDFWVVPHRIGIEVKRGKPNRRALEAQVARYCTSPQLDGLIMVVERCVFDHPQEVHGKPVEYISLSKLFGLAV